MSNVKPECHLSFRTGGRLLSGSFTIADDMVANLFTEQINNQLAVLLEGTGT
jgi:hypothetical protein